MQHRAKRPVFQMGMGTIEMTRLRIFAPALTALFCLGISSSGAFAGIDLASQKYETAAGKEQKPRKAKSSGLAGSEGHIKRKIMFTADTTGGCKGLYKRYVAAAGHSAYAATIVDYFHGGGYICAAGLNAPTQAEAERRAIAECDKSRKQYKTMEPTGRCEISASK